MGGMKGGTIIPRTEVTYNKHILLKLSEENISQLDVVCKSLNISRSKALRMGIENLYSIISKTLPKEKKRPFSTDTSSCNIEEIEKDIE